MKKRSLVKKSLIPALGAVLVSMIALTGVSYAWFTTGTSGSVSDINVGVADQSGLQISADAATWKSTISNTDLTNAGTNQLPTKDIKPVSSVGGYTEGKQNMFLGTLDNETFSKLSATKETDGTGDSGNYIAFDLYFKVSKDETLQLDQTSSVTEAAQNTHLASRVSFTYLGTDKTYTPVTAKAMTGTAEQAGGAVTKASLIWEPHATTHTVASGLSGDNTKKPYYGISAAIESPTELTTINADPCEQSETVTTVENTADQTIATLHAGINKVRIYIWLEGQDADCLNDIASGSIKTALKFKLAA